MEKDKIFGLEKSSKRFWLLFGSNTLILLLFIILFVVAIVAIGEDEVAELKSVKNSNCNVQVIYLNGMLDTSYYKYNDGTETGVTSSEVIAKLIDAENDNQIKAIVLSVDSGGGSPVAGSEIADSLSATTKPSVAWLRTSATSAAYWAVVSADRLIANRNSSIGSIGVTSSYLDQTEKNKREGLFFQELSIGKYKDIGNPDKPITLDEKEKIMEGAEKIYENFIGAVSFYRNINKKSVEEIADGSYMLGEESLTHGLIDQIGGTEEIKQYLKSRINDEIEFCWQ